MQKKYFDRIKELSVYNGTYGMFPPSDESLKSLEYILDILEITELIDRIDPKNDIYPDNNGGIDIVYNIDDAHNVIIDVKDNFIILYNELGSLSKINERIVYFDSKRLNNNNSISIAIEISTYINSAKNK